MNKFLKKNINFAFFKNAGYSNTRSRGMKSIDLKRRLWWPVSTMHTEE